MATNVIAIVSGGRPTTHTANTPAELMELQDYDQVKFTEAVKGGL